MLLITDGNLNATDKTKFVNFLKLNAETLWEQGTTRPAILFGPKWTATVSTTDLSTQLSGAMLIEAAARLKTLGLIE
jgi:predicted alpha-1,6-mannanase (GH76 family)